MRSSSRVRMPGPALEASSSESARAAVVRMAPAPLTVGECSPAPARARPTLAITFPEQMERQPEPPPPRGHARRLASGSLAQQASQVSGLLSMLVLVTVLARRLQVAEFGVYGVLSSLAGYLLVIQNARAGAAGRGLAGARAPRG